MLEGDEDKLRQRIKASNPPDMSTSNKIINALLIPKGFC